MLQNGLKLFWNGVDVVATFYKVRFWTSWTGSDGKGAPERRPCSKISGVRPVLTRSQLVLNSTILFTDRSPRSHYVLISSPVYERNVTAIASWPDGYKFSARSCQSSFPFDSLLCKLWGDSQEVVKGLLIIQSELFHQLMIMSHSYSSLRFQPVPSWPIS